MRRHRQLEPVESDIERRWAHGLARIAHVREHIPAAKGNRFELLERLDSLTRKRNDVAMPALHSLRRNRPEEVIEVELVPRRLNQLAFAHHGQEQEFRGELGL